MAAIEFTEVTNATTPTDGTGIFDSLMETLNIHIEDQYKKNRIKSTDYASVYLGAMQSAMAESIQFVLQKQLTESQVEGAAKDNLLKDAQLNELRNKEEAELEKQWGYNVTRDTDGSILLGNSTNNGIIDRQGIELDKNVDVTERSTILKEAESNKQQALLSKELDIKTYENSTLQVDSHNTNLKQIDSTTKDIEIKERTTVLQESELSDKLLTSAKQRALLDEEKETADKQQLLLDIQKDAEEYKTTTLMHDEHDINDKKLVNMAKDIEVKDRTVVIQESELNDKLLTSDKQREAILKDIEIKERSTVIQEAEFEDKLLTTDKQRILLDEEQQTADKNQLLLDLQNDIETYKKEVLLKDEHNLNISKNIDVTKSTEVKERSIVVQESELADKLVTSEKQRNQLDVETKLAEQKIVGRKQSAIVAE